ERLEGRSRIQSRPGSGGGQKSPGALARKVHDRDDRRAAKKPHEKTHDKPHEKRRPAHKAKR
ncbi:MAG TPA: hypothetical protein PKI71_15970, partial [Candidatus Rifleibacterium sp.]|nr:hypothetical protein [Candidatus Rifleibacterium sp.]